MNYIYKLVFKDEDRFYIGQTKNLDKRYESHWRSLVNNTHHNIYLQNWFNKHKPLFMGMVVLCSFENKEDCDHEEVRLITDTYENNFNVSKKSCGGDIVSYHPLNNEIREKLSISSKLVWENPEYKQKMRNRLTGVGNPNYKDGRTMIHRACYDCSTTIKSYYPVDKPLEDILCTSCRAKKRTGELNSFYNRTHSDDARKAISDANKKRFLTGTIHGRVRKVVADGKVFQTCSDCARYYGISSSLVTYRVKSDKWNYHYLSDNEDASSYDNMPRVLQSSEKATDARHLNTRPVVVDGIYYKSVRNCSETLGIKASTLTWRIQSVNYDAHYADDVEDNIQSK